MRRQWTPIDALQRYVWLRITLQRLVHRGTNHLATESSGRHARSSIRAGVHCDFREIDDLWQVAGQPASAEKQVKNNNASRGRREAGGVVVSIARRLRLTHSVYGSGTYRPVCP